MRRRLHAARLRYKLGRVYGWPPLRCLTWALLGGRRRLDGSRF